ncbi:MAG TPA: hypothetical protein VNM49_15675 [Paenibacillus cookii]|nr:hypothetical protein [Paenibacillus cookii]
MAVNALAIDFFRRENSVIRRIETKVAHERKQPDETHAGFDVFLPVYHFPHRSKR